MEAFEGVEVVLGGALEAMMCQYCAMTPESKIGW